ncbi:Ig-like domain-containing protein [Cognaticolwellia mytili]|uniref:Ig-like domain-containing protein n=1 Tax=Cognaticolwellia mytili TaxID=1888913 RepID=UPI00117E5604|nr:Ig-like domain-containing protein [Cognaticolwellia mytili]
MKITKKQYTSKSSIIALLLTCTLLTSCGSDNNSDELAKAIDLETQRSQGTIIESVTIVGDHTRLRVGENHQLSATGIDSNDDIRDITNELIWSSSDTSIATVDSKGLVTALANSAINQGVVTITGTTINDIFGTGEMSVSDVAVTTINLKQIQPMTGSINTCIKASIKGDVSYADGYTSLNTVRDINFSLDNDTSAIIETDGTLYTSAAVIEHTIITAKTGNISGQLTVTADPVNLESLNILLDDEAVNLITVNIGERVLVNGQASLNSDVTTTNFIINDTISWSQAETGYAGITTKDDNKGTIFALKPGVTQLIGTCGGKQSIATLEVKGEANLDTIEINDGNDTISLAPLNSIELTLTGNYTSTPTSLNISEFSEWSINGSSLINAELINLGTNEATYKITSTSSTTGIAIISASYDGMTSTVKIDIE